MKRRLPAAVLSVVALAGLGFVPSALADPTIPNIPGIPVFERTIVLTGDHAGPGTLGLDTDVDAHQPNGVGNQDIFSDDLRDLAGKVDVKFAPVFTDPATLTFSTCPLCHSPGSETLEPGTGIRGARAGLQGARANRLNVRGGMGEASHRGHSPATPRPEVHAAPGSAPRSTKVPQFF